MSTKLKILSPNTKADLALGNKELAKIIIKINETIRSTPLETRNKITVCLDTYPDTNTTGILIQMLRDAGWTHVKLESSPCGPTWLELGKRNLKPGSNILKQVLNQLPQKERDNLKNGKGSAKFLEACRKKGICYLCGAPRWGNDPLCEQDAKAANAANLGR
jgi:hypothetical protein